MFNNLRADRARQPTSPSVDPMATGNLHHPPNSQAPAPVCGNRGERLRYGQLLARKILRERGQG